MSDERGMIFFINILLSFLRNDKKFYSYLIIYYNIAILIQDNIGIIMPNPTQNALTYDEAKEDFHSTIDKILEFRKGQLELLSPQGLGIELSGPMMEHLRGLIKTYPDLLVRPIQGSSILFKVSSRRHEPLEKFLIAHGAKYTWQEAKDTLCSIITNNATSTHTLLEGTPEQLSKLVKMYPSVVNAVIKYRSLDDPIGLTAFAMCYPGNTKLKEELLRLNADPKAILGHAVLACFKNISRRRLTKEKKTQQLKEVISRYTTEGGNLNFVNPETGLGLLHEAVFNQNYEIITFLLDNGSDVNTPILEEPSISSFFSSITALHLAIELYDKDMFDLLLERGADPTIPCKHNFSTLAFAQYVDNQAKGCFSEEATREKASLILKRLESMLTDSTVAAKPAEATGTVYASPINAAKAESADKKEEASPQLPPSQNL